VTQLKTTTRTCVAILLLAVCTNPIQAQTLDQQYEYYLEGRCQNMGFARDPSQALLPGQAGPNLFKFCSGPIQVAGPSTSSTLGGAAAAGEGRGEGAEDDSALRRRRDRLHHKENGEPDSGSTDVNLGNLGLASAFLSLDYLHERQKTTQYEAGRRLHGADATLGADYRFASGGLAGLALKYGNLSGDIDSGGHFDVKGGGIWAYGSWSPRERMFVDFAAGFDLRQVHTERIVSRQTSIVFPRGSNTFFDPEPALAFSDTNSREASAELRAGHDFLYSALSIGPRAAVAVKRAKLDPYTESGNTPMTLAFEEQTAISLRSMLGVQASRPCIAGKVVLVPQLNVDWVHEYRGEQRTLTAHFAEDLRPDPSMLRFLNEPPDRDWAVIRVSTVAVFVHGVSGFVALEDMVGHAYIKRYRASIGLRVEL
jgi:uncharacterized protein YhjY with autotransporter beta-barrel domain